jgi:hypothetical protein
MRYMFGIVVLAIVALSAASRAGAQDEVLPLSSLEAEVAELTREQAQTKADLLQGEIEALQLEIAALKEKAASIPDADARKVEEAKVEVKDAEIKILCSRLQIHVNRLKDLGVDVSAFQTFLIRSTGQVRLDNVSVDAAVGLIDGWFEGGKTWLVVCFFPRSLSRFVRFFANAR